MKKHLLFAAVASIALTGCTSEELAGGNPETPSFGAEDAITFGSTFKAVTRADLKDGDAANKLGNAFKVYGVKKNSTTTNYNKVFVDYTVTYANGSWDYNDPDHNQYIKYWDYKSDDYHFVAGSPIANFTFTPNATTGEITTATVTGLGGRLNHDINTNATSAVYIADPKVVVKDNYNQEVVFTFKAMQSKVRVGIYETIPGYKIKSIKFFNNATTSATESQYITLFSSTDNYFLGGPEDSNDASKDEVGGTITYNNWTTPGYTFAYTGDGLKTANYWEGGQYANGVPAVSSAGTIADLYGTENHKDDNGYFTVLPTAAAAGTALTLKCEYTLESLDNSGEEIVVDNATATIPADYTKWLPNYAYTYLFKITDSNLHPITFDAVVVNEIDNQVGTTTTVSTPSITVYQDGDVVANGITYKAGVITVKAMVDGDEVNATWSYVKLDGTNYDYTKDYEKLGNVPATDPVKTTWTSGALTSVETNKTYVIKAEYTDTSTTPNTKYTAYFVLVVGAAETGPNNTTNP